MLSSHRVVAAITLIAGVFFSSSALAVLYPLPSDGDWYQVQNADNYLTVCSSDDITLCDLQLGAYTLIKISSVDGSDTRTPFVIEDTDSGTAAIVHVTKECLEAIGTDCNASCPVAYLPSGVSCAQPNDDGSTRSSGDLIARFDRQFGYCESASRVLDFSAVLTLACVRQ